jgi:hypothetical protein
MTSEDARNELTFLGIPHDGVYVDKEGTISFGAAAVSIDEIDVIAEWFETDRIDWARGAADAGDESTCAADVEVRIYDPR